MSKNKGVGARKNKQYFFWILAAVLAAAVFITLVIVLVTTPDSEKPTEPTIQIGNITNPKLQVGKDLLVEDIGSYSGMYVEDGSNEIVSNILMIVLKNNSDKPLQYAELTLRSASGNAQFAFSTIPAGESVIVLEKNRKSFVKGETFTLFSLDNAVFFPEALSIYSDQLKIQGLDGAMNITNISGQDITGDIVVYYKNSAADMLYGGITYRVRIEGGLKAGEIKQAISAHFIKEGSRVMFVTAGYK